tara:strand:+ start:82 stop:408 length:327 start_codon:yes stop_codon:yes gene_type:complete
MVPRIHKVSTELFSSLSSVKGKTFILPFGTLKVYTATTDIPKVAVVVSKKVSGKAVERNEIKRKVFGVFERFLTNLEPLVYVVYMKKGGEVSGEELEKVLTESHFLDI